MQKSDAYKRYMESSKTGRIPYFDEEEFEDIVLDLEEEFRLREAKEALAWGLKYHPDSEELDKLRILLLIDGGDYDEAERQLARYEGDGTRRTMDLSFTLALKRKKYDEAYLVCLAAVKAGVITVEDACDGLDAVWDAFPREVLLAAAYALKTVAGQDAVGLRKIGIFHINLEEYEAAIGDFNAALDLNAYDVDAWRCLAKCYLEMKELEKCRDACHYGLAIDDGDVALHYMRGYSLCKLGKSDSAIADLLWVCEYREGARRGTFQNDLSYDEQQMQIIAVYEMLAECYEKEDCIDEAIGCWLRLAAIDAGNTNIYYHLASLHIEKGDLPRACRWIDESVKREPKQLHYLALKASILTVMHRFDEAEEILNNLLRACPQNKTYLLAKANLCVNQHRWDEAETLYQKLLELKPKDKAVRALIVAYFESTGRGDIVKDLR